MTFLKAVGRQKVKTVRLCTYNTTIYKYKYLNTTTLTRKSVKGLKLVAESVIYVQV